METWMIILIAFCTASPVYSGVIIKDKKELKTLEDMPSHPPQIEDSFKKIHNMDEEECIPRLLCELAATSQNSTLSKEESSILAVFSNNSDKTITDRNGKSDGKSPLTLYKYATDIGKTGSEVGRCQKNFNKCPLTGTDLMLAFKNIIVKH